ncbi:MAG: hypothetical protein KDD99_15020 [Bacteroidetes bacterium]|nr:hypothetical protein [Bacteroidota bacterium]
MKRRLIIAFQIALIVIPLLLFIHIYFSWGLPSEGENAALGFWTLLITPICAFLFSKIKHIYFAALGYFFIGVFLIVFSHVFFDQQARRIWPWTEITAKIDEACPAGKCDWDHPAIEYTFPIINQKVKISVGKWEERNSEEYIELDYGRGRVATFKRNLEFNHVD